MTHEPIDPPVLTHWPATAAVPLVVSSPHSGRVYPRDLLARVAIGRDDLRRLEDVDVDRLLGGAPELGAALVSARYARAFVDANREPWELDRHVLDGPVPDFVNTASAKARAGLGTVPTRIGTTRLYAERLHFEEIRTRVQRAYWPYHDALEKGLARARARFGLALLLDCHSMPSPPGHASAADQIDVALGDRFGRSCCPSVVEWAEAFFRARGLKVARNRPYAGGFITSHYGRPQERQYALQLEIRRSLYMDEATFESNGGLAALRKLFDDFLAELATRLQQLACAVEAA
jgi:N-formylglutamate amidohydrolase